MTGSWHAWHTPAELCQARGHPDSGGRVCVAVVGVCVAAVGVCIVLCINGEGHLPVRIAVVALYLCVVLGVGLAARRRDTVARGASGYYLAGRLLGPLAVLATMAATNFSGFTVVGFAGAGYRIGLGFYPVMAIGTGLMAVSFAIVGLPAHRIGRRLGLVTPAELIGARFGRGAAGVTACAMALFTLPYLAIQPMAAGYALEALLGIPYVIGAALVTVIVALYVLAGGMRSVVWTDFAQGILMTAVLAVGLFVVVRATGGGAFTTLTERFPALTSRPGGDGSLVVGIWASYMLLWFLADPMLPQLFQRFYAARGERPIVISMALYPIVTGVLFFLPVAIGALGRLHVPGLVGKETDRILPMLMENLGGDWLAALACAGLLAGIMSTMDSQLLTMGSVIERDVFGRGRGGRGLAGRVAIVAMAVGGFLLSIRPPASILSVATQAFAGLAVLFPAFFAAIHIRRVSAPGVIISIIAGELVVALSYAGVLSWPGMLTVVPAAMAATLVLLVDIILGRMVQGRIGSAADDAWFEDAASGLGRTRLIGWCALVTALFVLSVDWWRFGVPSTVVAGLPGWVWYFFALSVLVSLAFTGLGRRLLRYRAGGSPVPSPKIDSMNSSGSR